MKKEEIHLNDIQRILFGAAPPEFLIEVFVRSVIMYVALVVIVRLLGKRTNAQLTITERAVFITLGAIIAMPMQGPPTGILVGIVILISIMIFQRSLTRTFFISRKWEELMQGRMRVLVKDSVLNMEELQNLKISRQQLFEQLRNKNVRQLGEVARVYLEACGNFTIYENEPVQPGLSVMPVDMDKAIERDPDTIVCLHCGKKKQDNAGETCSNCKSTNWVKASNESVA